MNRFYKAIACSAPLVCALLFSQNVDAQMAFNRGSLLISATEGTTTANYTTTNNASSTDVIHTASITGNRDPLTLEYGLSRHWGIGLTMGTDLYNVNTATMYNFQNSAGTVKAQTSEITIDGNYHFFITRRLDLSAFLSLGPSSVSFKGTNGDANYQYNAGGLIIRSGTKAKYYLPKRFGVTAMVSNFVTQCSTNGVKGNTVANNYTTSLSGYAFEVGLCYRVLR